MMTSEIISLKEVTKTEANPGLRIQDYWGRTGTIRWVGKFDNKSESPINEAGFHCGVEYDEYSRNPLRSDGSWKGKRYFECEYGKGAMCKVRDLYYEINYKCVELLRNEFKEQVDDWHDFELIKFGIARKFNMPKVYAMLSHHLEWRKKFKPSPYEYFPSGMVEDYPCGYTGTVDYDDNLIYCERPGNAGHCHPSDFVRKYTLPIIARWHAAGVEMGRERMRASNYTYKRVCYIVDLTKVSAMTRPMISFARTLANVEQDNYPENLGRVFIVNCPTFFRYAWKLVSAFIDARTNKKINFVAPGEAVNAMQHVMDEKDIPNFCGGTSTLWIETNEGRIGSDDESKMYNGPRMLPDNTTSSEYDRMEEDMIEGGTPIQEGENGGDYMRAESPRNDLETSTELTSDSGKKKERIRRQ